MRINYAKNKYMKTLLQLLSQFMPENGKKSNTSGLANTAPLDNK